LLDPKKKSGILLFRGETVRNNQNAFFFARAGAILRNKRLNRGDLMAFQSIPTAVTADRSSREMKVQWNDGHTSQYPFHLLRAACPCAACRGGHENMRPEPDEDVFQAEPLDGPETRMVRVEGVGSYAITFEWEDGHHFGIYNWFYLRALCPCVDCRKDK
jgi:DUF971 family protein